MRFVAANCRQPVGVAGPEREHDPRRLEPLHDLVIDRRLHIRFEIHIAQDHPQFKLQRIRPDGDEIRGGSRVQHHQRLGFGNFQQHLFHQTRVGAIGHSHRHDQAAIQVEPGPVRHHARHQIGVGHNDIGAVKGFDPGGADRDRFHDPHHPAHFDPVAFGHRAFHQQDDTRHKVRHDVLQAKSDPDRQGTGDDGKRAEIDACRSDGDQRRQENADIADTGYDGVLATLVHRGLGQDRGAQSPLKQPGQAIPDAEHRQKLHKVDRRNAGPTQRQALVDPDPDLGNVGGTRPPDHREHRQRGHGQAKAHQHRHQSLARPVVCPQNQPVNL